jgi:MarR family transcriptional regulator, organic hydroperoxide resistance regulator
MPPHIIEDCLVAKPRLPKLNQSVGNLLRRASRGLSRRLEAGIESGGISTGVWYYLRVLWEEDGLTQSELSDRLGVMGPTTVSALDRLERKGLVKRERVDDDKRKIMVKLTPKGRALEEKMAPIAVGILEEALAGLSPIERQEFLRMLTLVDSNLESGRE